jgi:hypothetical protein
MFGCALIKRQDSALELRVEHSTRFLGEFRALAPYSHRFDADENLAAVY